MQLWNQRRINVGPDGETVTDRCCSLDDLYDARTVAVKLGFPFYVVNLEDEFEQDVVRPFVTKYLNGLTPSPCVACNSFLKFDKLVELAKTAEPKKSPPGITPRPLRRIAWSLGVVARRQSPQRPVVFPIRTHPGTVALRNVPAWRMTKQEVRDMPKPPVCRPRTNRKPGDLLYSGRYYSRFIERYLEEDREKQLSENDLPVSNRPLVQLAVKTNWIPQNWLPAKSSPPRAKSSACIKESIVTLSVSAKGGNLRARPALRRSG